MSNEYKILVKATQAAVLNGTNPWKEKIAPLAVAYFGTLEAFQSARAQYIVDGMLPVCLPDEREAYDAELADSRSKAHKERAARDAAYKAQHDLMQARKTAIQKKLSGYADRIARYGWPVEPTAEEAAAAEAAKAEAKDPLVQMMNRVRDAVKKGQDLEAAPWNHGVVMKHLLAAEALMAAALGTQTPPANEA